MVEGAPQQGRHADHEAERHGHQAGQQKTEGDPAERVAELDQDALVVGTVVVEWIGQLFPDRLAHLRGRGKAIGLGGANR